MQAQLGYYTPGDDQSGAYADNSTSSLYGAPGVTHFAVGAFTGSDGLPPDGTLFTSEADYEAYAQDLLAKHDQISSEGLNFVLRYVSSDWLVIGGNGSDAGVADGSIRADGEPPTIVTGSGQFFGGAGDDYFLAGSGDDLLTGDANNDTLSGGLGDDTLQGGDGDDVLSPGAGTDVVDGGDGSDTLVLTGQSASIVLDLRVSSDVVIGGETKSISHMENVRGGDGDDLFTGGSEANTLLGAGGDDTLVSGGGADSLDGGDGHDVVRAGVGDQVLSGGSGTDVLSYADVSQGVSVSLSAQDPTVAQTTGVGAHTITGFENLTGSGYADALTGDQYDNVIQGGDGADTIDGGNGDDVLSGGAGVDTVSFRTTFSFGPGGVTVDLSQQGAAQNTGAGSKTLTGFENVIGSNRADTITGDSSNNVIDGGDGGDTLTGGGGVDTASFLSSSHGVTINLSYQGGSQYDGLYGVKLTGFENLQGSTFNDRLTGDGADNTLSGGGGIDTIDGAGGVNTLKVEDRPGLAWNKVDLTTGEYSDYLGDFARLSNIQNVLGGGASDTIIDDSGDSRLDGAGGSDSFVLNTGNDTVIGGAGSDAIELYDTTSQVTLDLSLDGVAQNTGIGLKVISGIENATGGTGDDILKGGSADNSLSGGGGDDLLVSGGGADALHGGDGNDTLVAGAGAQQLDGGSSGEDVASYADAASGITISLAQQETWQRTAIGYSYLTDIDDLIGSTHADALTGDDNANIIDGHGGNDVIHAGGGADTILASAGNQTLDGGDGIDTLSFAKSTSGLTLSLVETGSQASGGGAYTVSNIENLIGSDQGDSLTGDANANSIQGGGGPDTIDGGGGDDTLAGGGGVNTVSYLSATTGVKVNLGLQGAAQTTNVGSQTLSGFTNIQGSTHDDVLTGDAADNTIASGGGDDTLVGGGGVDTVSYLSAANGVTVDLTKQGAAQTTGVGSQTLSGFTNIQGSTHSDVLTGDAADNTFVVSGGYDTIDGGAGVNTVSFVGFDLGAVNLTRGDFRVSDLRYSETLGHLANIQNVLAGDSDSGIFDNGGNNYIDGGAGSDTIVLTGGDDTVDGGSGRDQLQSQAFGNVTFDLTKQGVAQDTGQGLVTITNIEDLFGGGGNDTLIGDAEANQLNDGYGGSDYIVSGGGDDTIHAGQSNDFVVAGVGNQHLDGDWGAGFGGSADVVSYQGATTGVSVSLALQGQAQTTGIGQHTLLNFEWLTGSVHSDTLTGDDNANQIDGNGGDDTVQAGAGADTILATAGHQLLDGGGDVDTVSFAASSAAVTIDLSVTGPQTTGDGRYTISNVENVVGSNGADTLKGDDANTTTDGANLINGGNGADTIIATAGDDTLIGGAGADTVSYAGVGSGVTVDLTATGVQQQQFGSQVLSGIENVAGTDYADSLTGSAAANSLNGGAGADTIVASTGADTLVGGSGPDTLSFAGATGGVTVDLTAQAAQQTGLGLQLISGFETVIGSSGADSLTGDANANLLDGGAGADTLNGRGGADTLLGSESGDHLDGGTGIDLASYAGATAGVNVDLNDATHIQNVEVLQGSNLGDTLAGGASQTVNGGAGDDLIHLASGVTADGGDGIDTADFSSFTAGLNATLEGTASETDNGVTTTFNDFEAAVLTQLADNVTINSPDWTVSAGAGSDILRLYGGGQVALDGGLGDDYVAVYSYMAQISVTGDDGDDRVQLFGDADTAVYGGVGADSLQVLTSFGSSTLNGGEGNDAVYIYTGGSDIVMNGGDGDDTVNLYSDDSAGSDITLNGGDGIDKITTTSGSNLTVDLSLSVAQDTGQGLMVLNSVEAVQAFSGNDHLAGSAVANGLYGGDGNDTIAGGSGGDDTLVGQGGTDTLTYANATSRVVVDLYSGLAQVGGSTEHLGGFEVLIGSGFGDDLAGAATIQAGGGDDVVHGGGSVILDGGAGTDTLTYDNAGSGVSVSLAKQGKVQSTGVGDQTLTGFENLTGSAQADRLSGDSGANAINGGDGADTILPTGGADTLDGGAGIDTLDLSRLSGGVTVDVAGGVYRLSGSPDVTISNFETFVGTSSDDTFTDGQGAQSYLGGAGADVFYAAAGADTFDGGVGIDTLNYSNVTGSGVTVNLGARAAQATGVGSETILRVENLIGSAQADHLTGSAGANVIVGGGGADTIDGGGGDDTLTGGGAGSTVSYASATTGVQVVLLNQGGAQDTNVGQQLLQGFSNLEGSSYRDFLVGDLEDNVISAGAGRDYIFATPGNDSYDGGAGLDLLIYQGFNQPLTVDFIHGQVQVAGFTQTITGIEAVFGNDASSLYIDDDAFRAIVGGDGRDTVVAGQGDDTYNGGDGIDLLDMSAGNGVSVDLKSTKAQDTGMGDKVIIGFEQVIGSAGSDTLLGTSAANLITGGAGGDDVINGRGGADTLQGGAGGHSTVSYAGAAVGVHVSLNLQGAAQDTGVGQQVLNDFTSLTGSSHDDVLTGAGRAERLEGGAGGDQLSGLGGADTLVGGTGLDTLDGGAAKDLLVTTGDGDRLTGGTGTDVFAFSALRAGGAATITDLGMTETIDLTAAEADRGETFHQVDRFTSHAGEFALRYDANDNLTTVRFDLDGNGKADHTITLLGGDYTGFTGFEI